MMEILTPLPPSPPKTSSQGVSDDVEPGGSHWQHFCQVVRNVATAVQVDVAQRAEGRQQGSPQVRYTPAGFQTLIHCWRLLMALWQRAVLIPFVCHL